MKIKAITRYCGIINCINHVAYAISDNNLILFRCEQHAFQMEEEE